MGQDSSATLGDAPGEMAALPAVNLGEAGSATAVDAAVVHTCALLDDATVKCWGLGSSGRLGQGGTVHLGDNPGEMASLPPIFLGVEPGPASLSVVKSAEEAEVTAGEAIEYHVVVTNTGVPALTGIEVSDANAPDCAGPIPDLGAGESHTVDCTYTSTMADVGTYPNTAWVDSDQTVPVASNEVETTVVAPSGISGSVSGSGGPVGGVFVAVMRTSDFSLAAGGVADGAGEFSVEVPPGSYFVYVVDGSGDHVSGFHGAPTLVTVTAETMSAVDPVLVPVTGSVSGSVTESGSGDPIPGAWVLSLSASVANSGALEALDAADGSGGFVLGGLGVGNHFVGFVDPSGGHETRFFPNSPNVPEASLVGVTAGNATTANGSLPAQAVNPGGEVVSGTVTESGSGDPLAGVHVVALRASDFAMARGAVTDAAGHYELDVAAGGYHLAFVDSSATHAMEWFDDQPSTGLGSAATVSAPGTADAALVEVTGSMAGTVTDDPSGVPLVGAWIVAVGPNGVAGGAVTAVDGTWEISGLVPGTYRVAVVDPNGGRVQEYWDGAASFETADPITITAAHTATIDAALAAP